MTPAAAAAQKVPFLHSSAEGTALRPRIAAKAGRKRTAITIVLADAGHAVREGLGCLLEREKDFEAVGEVADGEVPLPGLHGLEVMQHIREASPVTAILVVSRYAGEQRVATALSHGAAGFVVKQATGAELRAAIRRVSVGARYLSSPFLVG